MKKRIISSKKHAVDARMSDEKGKETKQGGGNVRKYTVLKLYETTDHRICASGKYVNIRHDVVVRLRPFAHMPHVCLTIFCYFSWHVWSEMRLFVEPHCLLLFVWNFGGSQVISGVIHLAVR